MPFLVTQEKSRAQMERGNIREPYEIGLMQLLARQHT
jgi:hypothetical protein